jgi:putative two-component system response regulator
LDAVSTPNLESVARCLTAWDDDRAIGLLRESAGSHFDPACVDAFLSDWQVVMEIRNQFKDDEAEIDKSKLGEF